MNNNNQNIVLDDDGHLMDSQAWNAQLAQTLADTLGVTLTDTHLKILHSARKFFTQYHHPASTRALINHLKTDLDATIDNATLQTLFHTGLVARHINRIAGLPKPANCL